MVDREQEYERLEYFARQVRQAMEYTLQHQRLDEDECCRRRHATEEWLGDRDRLHGWMRQVAEREVLETPAQRAAKEVARAAAVRRAEALLLESLTAPQREEYQLRGYFHVTVGERRFRITKGRSHNVKEVDARSRILRTLCAHPVEAVPDADTMLAQKLMLENRPTDFFKLANVMKYRRPRTGRTPVTPITAEMAREALNRVPMAPEMEVLVARQEAAVAAALDTTAIVEPVTFTLVEPAAGVEPVPARDVRAA